MSDPINPDHYKHLPVQAIEVTRHFTFNLGNAIKYIWRAGKKSKNAVEDLRKAIWYIEDEIARLETKPAPEVEKNKRAASTSFMVSSTPTATWDEGRGEWVIKDPLAPDNPWSLWWKRFNRG